MDNIIWRSKHLISLHDAMAGSSRCQTYYAKNQSMLCRSPRGFSGQLRRRKTVEYVVRLV